MSMQVGTALRAGVEHRTPLPQHLSHDGMAPGDQLLHQLLLQHLRLLQHGLQIPRDGERSLLQREVVAMLKNTDTGQTATVSAIESAN